MTFTSLHFLLFFPAVVIIYYLLPQKVRWGFLLIASYFFYINIKPVYAILLAGVTLTTYLFTRLIDRAKSERNKKRLLIADVVLTLFPLFFFKYFSMVNHTIIAMLQQVGIHWLLPDITFILPVGISFYTFMAIGYAIDVYNEDVTVEKNLAVVALFLSFFPVVLSGPIERAGNMLSQFRARLNFNYPLAVKGLKLMLWGYFMKLVIADRIAIYTEQVFRSVDLQPGTSLLMATILYPVQVYGDLGGYSLIAIGCANIMGINVIQNFNRPFFATTMSKFWQRWHISLISWLTDYVFTPLSYSFRSFKISGIMMALMLTFIISGIWHGAQTTFIIWGAIQGAVLSFEALTMKRRSLFEKKFGLKDKWWYLLLNTAIIYMLFAFSLLFGGAVGSISKTITVFVKVFTDFRHPYVDRETLVYAFIGIFILFISEIRDEYFPGKFKIYDSKHIAVRWPAYLLTLAIIVFAGVYSGSKFIYFQF